MSKIKVIGGGLIAFTILFAVFFAYQKATKNSTIGMRSATEISWKTYTNAAYGYSIQYPSDWTYDADEHSGKVYLFCDYGKRGGKPCSGLEEIRNPWDYGTGVKITIDPRNLETYIKEFHLKRSQEAYSINGVKAWKIVGDPEYPSMGIDLVYIHVTKNGVNYVLESPFYPIDKYIIDTFKFVR